MPRLLKTALLCAVVAAPALPASAAMDTLFDGGSAVLPAFAFPDIFGRRPAAPQDELARAAGGDENAIVGLSDLALMKATSDQKIAMLKTLIKYSHPQQSGNGNDDPNQPPREQAIIRILGSSKDAASFDRVFFRIDPRELPRALSDPQPVFDMVERNRAAVVPGDWDGLSRYIDTVADTKSSGKNNIEFLIDAGAIAPGLAVLEGAKTSIHLEVFQLQADEYGWTVARLLADKAKAGVHVRIMIDDNGSSVSTDPEIQKLLDFMRAAGATVIVKTPTIFASHLDHRKVLVVDGDTAFTGGMNIGLDYQKNWHDQQTLIQGPAVTALQSAFLERWRAAGGTVPDAETPDLFPPLKDQPGGAETRVVAHEGAAKDQNIRAMYLRAIGTAEHSIRIANPYFVDASVVAELIRAARRHVKVQVVLPEDNDQALVQRGSRAYYPDLLAAGVEIYEYQGRMAHEKVAVFDSRWSTFGSSNLDSRSLRYNDELNLAVSDPGVARYIETNLFDEDLKKSTRITSYSPNLREKLDRSLEDQL
ncbi:MAG: phosphatidylserine/phosphatidylglycerophosphate/cardiolipin synthase family protein [Elusimicrobiota bacterium]